MEEAIAKVASMEPFDQVKDIGLQLAENASKAAE